MAADDISLGIELNTADFIAKMDQMNRRLDEFASHSASAEKAGSGLFAGISGGLAKFGLMIGGIQGVIGALGGVGSALQSVVAESSEAAEGQAQLNAVLESTGGKAGVTADAANDLASSLQLVTKFTDDQVLASENMLLTFTHISSSVFPQATEATLNMAQAFGGDASQAAVQLGKALNDPIAGISALSRVGVTFTQAQKDQIAAMMQAGDVAGAQTVILKELETEFGGAARAAGATFPGQLAILSHRFDDLKQSLGDALMPALQSLVTTLNSPQVQAGLEAAVQALAAGLAALVPFIGQATAAALDFIGTVAGLVAGTVDFLQQANLLGPVLLGIATAAIPPLIVAFGQLAGAAAGAAVSMIIATAPITIPLLAIAAAVAALKVAWDNDFLGMKTTITEWADWANQEVDRVVQHDAGSPYWMKKYGEDIRVHRADVNTQLEGMRDDFDQSQAMIEASAAQHGQQQAAITANVWQTIYQTTTSAAQEVVNAVAQAGAAQAQGYINNMVKAYGTGQPAVDEYLAFLIKRHDLGDALAIMGRNSAIKFLNALVVPVANGLEKMANSFASISVLKGMPGVDQLVGGFRNASEAIISQLGKATGQWQGFTSSFHAEVPKITADTDKIGKGVSKAGADAAKAATDMDALGRALTQGLQQAAQAAATNGPAQALSGMIDLMKSATDAKMPAIASTIQGWLAAAAKGAGPSAQAIHDQVVAWLTKLESSGNTHLAAFARAALDQLAAFTAAAQAKLDAAAQERNDKAGKAAADALGKQLETQQAQRDLQQQMVDDATKNYQAYADAVKKGYETAGDAMSAAVQRQLEDNQRMRDAQAAQQQAAQQLAQSLAGVATAMQDHSKTALDIMQQLGPLAQQAAAAGAGGLAQVINQYLQQAASGANVNMQDVYQAITGWLQQATQSGDAMLAVFARNALQHLAISQQIQAATDSLIPFQSAVDGARASLENANQAVQEAQDAVGRYRTELQSAQDDLRHFTQAPLEGEHAFSEQLFANQQAQAALQLRINQMMAGGANSQNPQLKALQTQLENLRRAGENIRLQEQLTIGQERHDLENQANGPPQEISAGDAAAGIDAAKARIDAANAALNTAQDRLTSLQRVQAGAQQAVADATAAFNAQQAAVQALTAQLQSGAPAVQQFGTALGTGLGTMGPAAQTALGAVDTAFGAVFGTGAGGQGGAGGQVGSIMQLLFAHDENAFFAKLDAQTNERLDGYTAGTWASKLTILDERISDGLGTIKQTAVDLATGIGTAIGDGMVAGIQSAAAAVAAAAVAVVQGAIAAAQAAAQVHSPSKKFAEIGAYMGQGMAQGLAGQGPAVASASAGLANQAAGAAVATVPVGGVGGAGTAALPAINFTAYLLDPFGGQRQLQVLREEMAYAQYSATRSTP